MMRPILPLSAFCLLFAACEAPKAVLVEENEPTRASTKPTGSDVTSEADLPPLPAESRPGLRLPPNLTRFPEEGDFKPGAAAQPAGGAAPVISSPPPAKE